MYTRGMRKYKKVKVLLKLKEMTYLDLAVKMKVSYSRISSYLQGYRRIPRKMKYRIAKALGIEYGRMEEFFNEEE